MPVTTPGGAADLGLPWNLIGQLALAVLLILVLATVFLSDRIGRRLPARSTGFLRGAGFYLAVKSLACEPPATTDRDGQDPTTLRIAWLVRNDWTGRRGLAPAGVGLIVDGVTYSPATTEPAGDLIVPSRSTADLVTCYRLPGPAGARIAAGELGLTVALRLDPGAAEPLATAPLDVGWLLHRPGGDG